CDLAVESVTTLATRRTLAEAENNPVSNAFLTTPNTLTSWCFNTLTPWQVLQHSHIMMPGMWLVVMGVTLVMVASHALTFQEKYDIWSQDLKPDFTIQTTLNEDGRRCYCKVPDINTTVTTIVPTTSTTTSTTTTPTTATLTTTSTTSTT
ncbi:hypothetical protein Hamer_G024231, partial [Homarus americanus]